VNEPWWRALLREQQGSGFVDVSGAEGSVVVPVSDTLLSTFIRSRLPPSAPVSDLELHAEPDNRFRVRVKLKASSFLPALSVRFVIVGQPQLPESPYLHIDTAGQSLGALMRPLVRAFAALPPWIRYDEQSIRIDLRGLMTRYGAGAYFPYVTDLRLTTTPGRFIVSVRATLPGPQPGASTFPEPTRSTT
jgi:hypothetical protein